MRRRAFWRQALRAFGGGICYVRWFVQSFVAHGNVSYYRGARESSQTRRETRVRMKRKRIENQHRESGRVRKAVRASPSDVRDIEAPARATPLSKLVGGERS